MLSENWTSIKHDLIGVFGRNPKPFRVFVVCLDVKLQTPRNTRMDFE
jgi:hypothetical protein